MRTQDDAIVFERLIAPAQAGADVVADDRVWLFARNRLAEIACKKGLELERAKSVAQVRSRFFAPCPAATAKFG